MWLLTTPQEERFGHILSDLPFQPSLKPSQLALCLETLFAFILLPLLTALAHFQGSSECEFPKENKF